MRYLICANTPAHVHLYRNAVDQLEMRDHECLVLARDYGCTISLCEYYDLPYVVYGGNENTSRSLALSLPSQSTSIVRAARSFDPDVVFGRGAYAALAGSVTDSTLVLLMDSNPWQLGLVLPAKLADYVLTTGAFKTDLGPHHYRFDGLTENAYLHPDVYDPDPSVRDELGVSTDESYAIVRFNAFGAFHDIGEAGFSRTQGRQLVRQLAEHTTVFVSNEGDSVDVDALPTREYDLHPARIHDALAEASLFVADTGTMVTEAALVGTPAVRASRRAGEDDLGEFEELHERGLVRNVLPQAAIEEASRLLTDDTADSRWQAMRDQFFEERIDLTALIVDAAEHPETIPTIVSEIDPASTETDDILTASR